MDAPRTQPAIRVNGFSEIQEDRICYWFEKDPGVWYLHLPHCGTGSLRNHQVTENPDGSITASPSVLMTGHYKGTPNQRHGYIRNGIWEEV